MLGRTIFERLYHIGGVFMPKNLVFFWFSKCQAFNSRNEKWKNKNVIGLAFFSNEFKIKIASAFIWETMSNWQAWKKSNKTLDLNEEVQQEGKKSTYNNFF